MGKRFWDTYYEPQYINFSSGLIVNFFDVIGCGMEGVDYQE